MQKKQFMVFRLDDNVIITLLAVCVIASLAFVVRYSNYKPCGPFNINTIGNTFNTGSIIRFETDVKDFKELEWDFGDNQTDLTTVSSSIHSYDYPGEYVITLSVDGRCTQYKTIFVRLAPKVVDSTLVPRVVIPENTEVGKPTSFADTTRNAVSWEWRFGETANVDAISKNPVYVYRTPGWKTISLVINGNINNALIRKIFVNPAKVENKTDKEAGRRPPPIIVQRKPETDPLADQLKEEKNAEPKATEPAKAPEISVAEFKQMLYGVAGGSQNAGSFAKYFCDGNLNTYTNLNGEPATFNQFCARLAKLKKASDIRNMTVTLKKNQETNCITAVDVIVKVKSGLFKLNSTKLK